MYGHISIQWKRQKLKMNYYHYWFLLPRAEDTVTTKTLSVRSMACDESSVETIDLCHNWLSFISDDCVGNTDDLPERYTKQGIVFNLNNRRQLLKLYDVFIFTGRLTTYINPSVTAVVVERWWWQTWRRRWWWWCDGDVSSGRVYKTTADVRVRRNGYTKAFTSVIFRLLDLLCWTADLRFYWKFVLHPTKSHLMPCLSFVLIYVGFRHSR